MSARTWLAAGAFGILVGVNGYLLYVEEDIYFSQIKTDEDGAVVMKVDDPLLKLNYIRQNREENLAAFGMDEGMVKATLARIRKIEDAHVDRIKALLKGAGNVDEVADALCGETNLVRPRYGALRFLVEEKDGRRRAVDMRKTSALEWQDWSKIAPIAGVYAETEIVQERQPDATLMAIASILLSKEQDVLEHNAPWGKGIASQWSWSRVKKENPEVVEIAVDYFATMHLVVEIAQGDGSICDG